MCRHVEFTYTTMFSGLSEFGWSKLNVLVESKGWSQQAFINDIWKVDQLKQPHGLDLKQNHSKTCRVQERETN